MHLAPPARSRSHQALYYAHRTCWVLPVGADLYPDWSALPGTAEEARDLVEELRRRGATLLGMTRDPERAGSYLFDEASSFRAHLNRRARPVALDLQFEIWRLGDPPPH